MARRLEGQTFLVCSNNGVTAIAALEVVLDLEDLNGHGGIMQALDVFSYSTEDQRIFGRALSHVGKPVFTFVDPERLKHQPWFTGSALVWEALTDYISEEGGRIERSSFYVPFSNGIEIGQHGITAVENELRFRTNRPQFRETFGISLGEVYRQRKPSAASATEG